MGHWLCTKPHWVPTERLHWGPTLTATQDIGQVEVPSWFGCVSRFQQDIYKLGIWSWAPCLSMFLALAFASPCFFPLRSEKFSRKNDLSRDAAGSTCCTLHSPFSDTIPVRGSGHLHCPRFQAGVKEISVCWKTEQNFCIFPVLHFPWPWGWVKTPGMMLCGSVCGGKVSHHGARKYFPCLHVPMSVSSGVHGNKLCPCTHLLPGCGRLHPTDPDSLMTQIHPLLILPLSALQRKMRFPCEQRS